jgi:hypothetical protein
LLPNTCWARFSFCNYFELAQLSVSTGNWHYAACGLTAVTLIIYLMLAWPSPQKLLLWTLFLVYTVWHCLAPILYSLNPIETSVDTGILMAIDVGMMAAFVAGRANALFGSIISLASMQALYAIGTSITHDGTVLSGTIHRAGGSFDDPRQTYILMLFALPLSVTMLVNAREVSFKCFFGLCVLLQTTALLLTWYRGGIVGFAISMVWLALQFPSHARRLLPYAICLLLLIGLVGAVRTSGSRNSVSTMGSDRGHAMLVKNGWLCFLSRWQMGGGIGRLHAVVFVDPAVKSPPEYFADPKNLYLQWLDDMGFGGGILLALFILVAARLIGRSRTTFAFGVGASWLAVLGAGLFDTTFGLGECDSPSVLAGSLLGALFLLPTVCGTEQNE